VRNNGASMLRSNAKRRNVRIVILRFLQENAGNRVRVSKLGEKLGVKQGSVWAILSDLRKLGFLPGLESLQPIPVDFNAERALEALRSLQRKRNSARATRTCNSQMGKKG